MSPKLLLLHAHPDDETISTGGLIINAISKGAQVLVVTATAGECGEVLNSEVEIAQNSLAELRATELKQAIENLGGPNQLWLGSFGQYRDSGMRGDLRNQDPAAIINQPLVNLVADFKKVVTDFDPDLIVTYEPGGGYGHPDHIRCNEIVLATINELEAKPKLIYPVYPESKITQLSELAQGGTAFFGELDLTKMSFVVKDELIDFELPVAPNKIQALLSYQSQLNPAGEFYQQAKLGDVAGLEVEYFQIAEISKPAFAVIDRSNPLAGLG
jgi:N-acetyl-1-D-myo-inositol-2-amino-2-deoxy-alpha-D-glucopyranoside deacetylase